MGGKKRGRGSDPHDKIRTLKSQLRTLERENQRLRKLLNRVDEMTIDEAAAEAEEEIKTKIVEKKLSCPNCGSENVTIMEVPVRNEVKIYTRCYDCKKNTKHDK